MGSKSEGAVFGDDDYLPLEALWVTFGNGGAHEHRTLTLCFWIYLLKSSKPGFLIRQGRLEGLAAVPFLTLDADRKLALHALRAVGSDSDDSNGHELVLADLPCPMEKWMHVGCEIGLDIARLHMDGVVVGESRIASPATKEDAEDEQEKIDLFGGKGRAVSPSVVGFAYYVRVLPQPIVTNHYVKNPPLELLLDGPSGASDDHELEEGGDGIWSVVGGKASCRRNFALDVALMDALGRSIHKEMELVAFLVYADTGLPVEKPKDEAEAPLLTTFDGVEFPSTERPIKLMHGRASFKLKISQLSSKCDNRLFRVCFDSPNTPKYPFLRVFSRPIRCVSRNRNHRTPVAPWKRSHPSTFPLDGAISPIAEDTITSEAPPILGDCNGNGVNAPSPVGNGSCYLARGQIPLKRNRTGVDKALSPALVNGRGGFLHGPSESQLGVPIANGDAQSGLHLQRPIHPAATLATCRNWPGSHPGISGRIPRQIDSSMGEAVELGIKLETQREGNFRFTNPVDGDSFPSPKSCSSVSDYVVFKYCLESIHGRAEFLKLFVMGKTDQELTEFATRVSQCTGCRHDGYQILLAKNLLLDANDLWSKATSEAFPPVWTQVMTLIEKRFTKISGCVNRMLSNKDKEFLKAVAGCGDFVAREELERLWSWIYPIALALRSSPLHATWDNEEPKWIEGMISREEVETLLRGPEAMAKPGTFLLRFASSRLWPHPDAGALVVSYVGHDMKINHKLLSLDESSGFNTGDRPLSEQLLSQPELTQLCKVPCPTGYGQAEEASKEGL